MYICHSNNKGTHYTLPILLTHTIVMTHALLCTMNYLLIVLMSQIDQSRVTLYIIHESTAYYGMEC